MSDRTILNNRWLGLSSALALLQRDNQADPFSAEMRLKAIIRTGEVMLRWADAKSPEDQPQYSYLVRTKFRFEQAGFTFSGQEPDWDADLADYRPLRMLKSSFEEVARTLPTTQLYEGTKHNPRMTLVEAVEWVRRSTECAEEDAIRSLKSEINSANISIVRLDAMPQMHRVNIIKQHGKLTFQTVRKYYPIQPSTIEKLDISLYGPGFLVPAAQLSAHQNISPLPSTNSDDNDEEWDGEDRAAYQVLAFVDTKEVTQIWPHSFAAELAELAELPESRPQRSAGRPGIRDTIFRALDEISREMDVVNLGNKQLVELVLSHLAAKSPKPKIYSGRTITKYIGKWRESRDASTR